MPESSSASGQETGVQGAHPVPRLAEGEQGVEAVAAAAHGHGALHGLSPGKRMGGRAAPVRGTSPARLPQPCASMAEFRGVLKCGIIFIENV